MVILKRKTIKEGFTGDYGGGGVEKY